MLPKKVKIQSNNVYIKKVSDASLKGAYGDFDRFTFIARINNELSKQQEATTFWHEILHAIVQTNSLRHVANISTDQEETIVRIFEVAIMSFIRDNPEAVKYLQRSMK